MPHWCLSFTIWLRCWAQFITQLDDQAGCHGPDDSTHYVAMRNGLIALQNIATTMMQATPDQDAAWLNVAHLIMGRLHRLCTTLTPSILAEPTTLMEERIASNRAASVTPKRPAPSPGGPSRDGPPQPKKPRGNPNTQQRQAPGGGGRAGKPRDGCPYHNYTTQHSIFECNTFKALSTNKPASG